MKLQTYWHDLLCICFQLLNLLDVIIDNAGSKCSSSDTSHTSTGPVLAPQISAMEADVNTDSVISSALDACPKVDGSSKPTPSDNKECETQLVLGNLPQAELQLLCSLLALEGYDYGPMLIDCFNSAVLVLSVCFVFEYLVTTTKTSSLLESGGSHKIPGIWDPDFQ